MVRVILRAPRGPGGHSESMFHIIVRRDWAREQMDHKMTPGRELDALVASKVMGLRKTEDGILWYCEKLDTFFEDIPHFSSNISSAWLVVEKLNLAVIPTEHGKWKATESVFIPECIYYEVNLDIASEGDTAPHAICLAALKAIG